MFVPERCSVIGARYVFRRGGNQIRPFPAAVPSGQIASAKNDAGVFRRRPYDDAARFAGMKPDAIKLY